MTDKNETSTSTGNVIPMPNLGKQASPAQVEKAMSRDPNFLMQMIHKNRTKGFEQLEKKLENLQERELLADPQSEMAMRDAGQALAALMKIVEAQNSLLEILLQNQNEMGEVIDLGRAHALSNSGHIQNLKECLVESHVISEETLQANWKDKIVPQFEKLGITQPGTEADPPE